MSAPSRHGFTLVELSLVLVIIGLIVGGVLVGRDLISSANIRAGISQIEKYNTAVNTFKLKYDCLPGDCPDPCFLAKIAPCIAANGQTLTAVDTTLGTGKLGFYNGFFGNTYPNGKIANFFWHLQLAGLTDGNYHAVHWTRYVGKDASFPPFVVGSGSGIFPFSFEGLRTGYLPLPVSKFNNGNKWYIGATASFIASGGGWGLQEDGGLTDVTFRPSEAYAIDSKLDDGIPTSGRVQAFWGLTRILHTGGGGKFAYGASYAQNPSATSCASSATSYNFSDSYGNQYLCQLVIDAPF